MNPAFLLITRTMRVISTMRHAGHFHHAPCGSFPPCISPPSPFPPADPFCFQSYRWGTYDGVKANVGATATCITQTFPVAAYATTPVAAPLRSNTGFSIEDGDNIFGPFDAGFSLVRFFLNIVSASAAVL